MPGRPDPDLACLDQCPKDKLYRLVNQFASISIRMSRLKFAAIGSLDASDHGDIRVGVSADFMFVNDQGKPCFFGPWYSLRDRYLAVVNHILTSTRKGYMYRSGLLLPYLRSLELRWFLLSSTALARDKTFYLTHPDLHSLNILSESGDVTGLVDWQWCVVLSSLTRARLSAIGPRPRPRRKPSPLRFGFAVTALNYRLARRCSETHTSGRVAKIWRTVSAAADSIMTYVTLSISTSPEKKKPFVFSIASRCLHRTNGTNRRYRQVLLHARWRTGGCRPSSGTETTLTCKTSSRSTRRWREPGDLPRRKSGTRPLGLDPFVGRLKACDWLLKRERPTGEVVM